MFFCLTFSHKRSKRVWIKESIGKGGFSTVYKAKDAKGRLYAVKRLKLKKKIRVSQQKTVSTKTISPPYVYLINYKIDVYKELKNQVKASHKNVLKVLDVFLRYKSAWIVLEYCKFSLTYIFPKESMSAKYTELGIWLLSPILDAIAHIHSCGIIHRDIKPENILICGNRPVLGDFGLSIESEGEEKYNGAFGTRDYCTPEIIRKESYGFSVDTWAWAICFIQIFNATETHICRVDALFDSYEDQIFDNGKEEQKSINKFNYNMNIDKRFNPPSWHLIYYDFIYPFVVLNRKKRQNSSQLCTWVKAWKRENNFNEKNSERLFLKEIERWKLSNMRRPNPMSYFKCF